MGKCGKTASDCAMPTSFTVGGFDRFTRMNSNDIRTGVKALGKKKSPRPGLHPFSNALMVKCGTIDKQDHWRSQARSRETIVWLPSLTTSLTLAFPSSRGACPIAFPSQPDTRDEARTPPGVTSDTFVTNVPSLTNL
jgi:hypothetical protein